MALDEITEHLSRERCGSHGETTFHVCMYVRTYACMRVNACMHVCMYVCMYVCGSHGETTFHAAAKTRGALTRSTCHHMAGVHMHMCMCMR